MKTTLSMLMIAVSLAAPAAMAQGSPPPPPGQRHLPPPQAYEDCRGKRAGETVQHATPEGRVAATCVNSPEGLVARPNQPRRNPADPQKGANRP